MTLGKTILRDGAARRRVSCAVASSCATDCPLPKRAALVALRHARLTLRDATSGNISGIRRDNRRGPLTGAPTSANSSAVYQIWRCATFELASTIDAVQVGWRRGTHGW